MTDGIKPLASLVGYATRGPPQCGPRPAQGDCRDLSCPARYPAGTAGGTPLGTWGLQKVGR
eukprot:1405685-Rhodomonas_salina.1